MTKKALITGITGQDAFYLANLLLSKGYEVHGTTRSIKGAKFSLTDSFLSSMNLHEWDLINEGLLEELIKIINPDEIYNLAAYTSGEGMYSNPVDMGMVNGISAAKILNAIKLVNPSIRFLQASSSEIYGNATKSPQSEGDPCRPRSPYGAAKLYAHSMVDIYRSHFGIFCCSAVLYNHESPMRPVNFVTRKITQTAAKIKVGIANSLVLGNLDVYRDWMHAKDAANAIWLIMQHPSPDDYNVSTGIAHSVRNFCEVAFSYLDLDYSDYVSESPEYFRPAELVRLIGCPVKLKKIGWSPKISFKEMVEDMVQNDLNLINRKT